MEIIIKTCTRCGKQKPQEDFKKRSELKSGYSTECKKCTVERTMEWSANNKEKIAAYHKEYDKTYVYKDMIRRGISWRKSKLKRKYNLTVEDVKQLVIDQDNKCKICSMTFGKDMTHRMSRFNIDHCHISNKVRGLLCTRCNTTLGKVNDDVNLLQSMIDYLNQKDIT